jgi:hypothetical protein
VLFALVYLLLRRLVHLVAGSSNHLTRDVEVVVLRHQLKVFKRQVSRPCLRRRDRLFMAAMSKALPRARWSSFVVSPQTLLRWHRDLVRRKWTYRRLSVGGRPPVPDEVRDLILRMGRENPRWGCVRIRGELAKLGIRVSATTIRTLLRGSGLGPAPRRQGPTWSEFLRAQAKGILALDFFTAETVLLQTLHVLFAIHIATRPVMILGVTRSPDSAWVTQQVRNLAVREGLAGIRFAIRDRDSKYSGPFDEVLRTEGVKIVKTPIRSPPANAFAERWVRTARAECLDWILVLGRRHLERVLRTYAAHYDKARPHRGLELKTPEPRPDPAPWPADGAESGGTTCWAGSSVSTNSLLDRRIEKFCALQAAYRCMSELRCELDERRRRGSPNDSPLSG